MNPADSDSTTRFYQFGPFRIDTAKRLLLREGEALPLTPKAFDTLLLLVERSGELVTKDELISRLWPDTFVEEGSLTRNVSALRKALGEDPREHRYIVTIPGQGYRFVAKVVRLAGETGNLRLIERTKTSIFVTEESPDDRDVPPVINTEAVAIAGPSALLADAPLIGETQVAKLPQAGPARRWRLPPAVVFVAIVLAAMASTAFVVYQLIGSGRQQMSKSSSASPQVEISRLTTTGNISNGRPAISPDGKFVVYAIMDSPRTSSLWLRQLATRTVPIS